VSDQDPAVRTWGESLAASADQTASTSALLRRLNGELDRLRADYNAVLLELAEKQAAIGRLIAQRDAATQRWADARILAENLAEERDGVRTARHARAYQLTDKGLAATKRVHLLTAGDEHVHCCGLLVTNLPAGDRTTLNPHGITCPAATKTTEGAPDAEVP
jgi:hypothetical protein